MFKRDDFVKLVDTRGNYRFGYIFATQEHGFKLIIDLNEEGISKITYDSEYAKNYGENWYTPNNGPNNFSKLLTETEKKMLPLLGAAMSTQQIATEMGISPVTVRAHIRDLKIKLQLETREQLVAYSQGIVTKLASGQAV